MSAIMDMYFNSDTLSIQEMLDIDIKSEIDALIGDQCDPPGMNFSDLPPLELDDVHDIRWFSHHSNSSFTVDFGDEATTMVNPNAVMPVISSLAQNLRSPSPSLKKSHLTFSPSNLKLGTGVKLSEPDTVKKDLLKKMDGNVLVAERKVEKKVPTIIKTINKVTPILSKSMVKTVTKAAGTTGPTVLTFRNTVSRQQSSPVTVTHLTTTNLTNTVRTIPASYGRKQQFNSNRVFTDDAKPAFPKPAYSYSCLIAMALKNSKTGSLPVSEIYNFMCKHFPFFKTAPNGWKNSVRHNLSLNKCFEKIEKPAVNGAQRKGCLWAMNPTKINKMDEEVQKWSRKDPNAIRRAMTNPENLEALERGEMKFSCSYDEENFGDSCGSADSEEGSDSEPELDVEGSTTTTMTRTLVVPSVHSKAQFINIRTLQTPAGIEVVEEEEEEEEPEEFDVEVAESMYDDDIEDDQDILRMEMALAQKELLEYDRSSNTIRRKTYIIQQD